MTIIQTFIRLVPAAPLLILGLLGMSAVIKHVPQYDDAYFATVAKNIAAGFGYASSFDSRVPFNPEITIGPSLILPGALGIRVLGLKYWVPAFVAFCISFLLLTVTCVLTLKLLLAQRILLIDKAMRWMNIGVVTTFIVLCFISEFSRIEFLGELPAALFVCAGALGIFTSNGNKYYLALGGTLLGMAVTTKLVVAPSVAVIVFVYAIFELTRSGSILDRILSVLLVFFMVSLPSLLFELYKLLSLGVSDYILLKRDEYYFFYWRGSGVNEMRSATDIFDLALRNFQKNIATLETDQAAGVLVYVFFLVLFGIVVGFVWKLFSTDDFNVLDYLACALLLAASIHLIWWLFFSSLGWYRHISPAIMVCSLAFIVSTFALLERRSLVFAALLIFILALSPQYYRPLKRISASPSAELASLQKTSEYLSRLRANHYTLLGCGWWANRRLEYLMPEPLNFKQCWNTDSSAENAILVIDRSYWNWEKNEATRRVEEKCSRLLFEALPFQVFDCDR
jgi:hypothetical protein